MEWFEKVKEFITGFPQLLQTSPRYGYLAFGYNLRMEVDLYTSGQLGRKFLAGNTRTKGFPFLAGGDPCRRDRTGFVAVLYFRQVAEHSFLR